MTDTGHYEMEDLVLRVWRYLEEMLPPPACLAGSVQEAPAAGMDESAEEAPAPRKGMRARRSSLEAMRESSPSYACPPSAAGSSDRDLGDLMDQLEETFQERLFGMIRERGLDETRVYKRAGLDRKLFSKIRCSRTYRPGKETVLALSLAMELNLDECRDLLARAGLALSPASRSDLIVRYCIEHEIYDLMTVNTLLDRFGEACLFVS